MRLVSFENGFGRLVGDSVIPMGDDLVSYLESGTAHDSQPVPVSDLDLRAPVPCPGKIICIGLNYRDHARETGQQIPDQPIWFPKYAVSIIGPTDAVVIPSAATQIDYEAELAVVIGRAGARRITPDQARQVIAGYTCANDVSSRALQFSSSQWSRGKAIDTFLPMGPHLVTADEIPDPSILGIRCFVNGELRQNSCTSEMVFGVFDLISFISQTLTLEPGDVLVTGTPFGVGMAMDPPQYLTAGDTVRVEIDGLGEIVNPITNEGLSG